MSPSLAFACKWRTFHPPLSDPGLESNGRRGVTARLCGTAAHQLGCDARKQFRAYIDRKGSSSTLCFFAIAVPTASGPVRREAIRYRCGFTDGIYVPHFSVRLVPSIQKSRTPVRSWTPEHRLTDGQWGAGCILVSCLMGRLAGQHDSGRCSPMLVCGFASDALSGMTSGAGWIPTCIWFLTALTPVDSTDGNFYGATQLGGAYGSGTIFKITPRGTLTTLHSFDGSDGALPGQDWYATDRNFYGTTAAWGYGDGTVFRLVSERVCFSCPLDWK